VTLDSFETFPVILKRQFASFQTNPTAEVNEIRILCERIKQRYVDFKWNPAAEGCGTKTHWRTNLKSHLGNSLLWAEFGTGSNTTLILGGVHPDEITPIPLAFRFAEHLASNPGLVPSDAKVIVAPLINPDGFFRNLTSRTNSNGVDLNRNLFTRDWYGNAKSWWNQKRQNNPKHFPGHIPNSEIETLFQIWLIDQYKPDKIISIHAPLGFYDYDGPGERTKIMLTSSEEKAKKLVHAMSNHSQNYKIVDYSFYPGSLGNYAGIERGIPTITLELETTNPKKIHDYWQQFSPGLTHAIQYPFKNAHSGQLQGSSLFFDAYSRHVKADTAASAKEF
jgi:protein MpaA